MRPKARKSTTAQDSGLESMAGGLDCQLAEPIEFVWAGTRGFVRQTVPQEGRDWPH